MSLRSSSTSPVRFGVFEFDPQNGELRKRGVKLNLQPQSGQVLLMLLESPGRVVTRAALRAQLWRDNTIVDFDRGLNRTVHRLREILRDPAKSPLFIESVPRRGYRFIAPVARNPVRIRASDIQSLAVLPLVNLSRDLTHEYLADGFTDALITAISRLDHLRVSSHTSVMLYKRIERSVRSIAQELDVDAVIEGAVLVQGERIRVTARLIDARDDCHLCSAEYVCDFKDLIGAQRDVSEAVAHQIRLSAMREQEQKEHVPATRPMNTDAREAYLAGRFFLAKWTANDLDKSISFLNQAVALAPDSHENHALLAHAYCAKGILGSGPSDVVYGRAKAAALSSLQLHAGSSEAHVALAEVMKGFQWDWVAAEREYRCALTLDPTSSIAHAWYADFLSKVGRHAEAVDAARRARESDPISADRTSFLGLTLYRARRFDEAFETCRDSIALDRYYPPAYWFLGLIQQQWGEHDDAITMFKNAILYSAKESQYVALLANAYAAAHQQTKARRIASWLTAKSKRKYVSPMDLAIAHMGLGNRDKVFSFLEQAFGERTMRIQELGQPMFDGLQCDQRYGGLLQRIGLATAA